MPSDTLEQAVRAYHAALPQNGRIEFPITKLDRLNIPVFVHSIWDQDGSLDIGVGYGQAEMGAQVSALGEASEFYFGRRALKKALRLYGSYHQLKQSCHNVIDPVSLCLDAGCGYTDQRVLCWVEARRYPSAEPVWIPWEAAAISSAEQPRQKGVWSEAITPVTNGLGAGLSFEQALTHGLLELIQRDATSITYRALDNGVAVELDAVQDVETRGLLEHFKAEGVEVIVKLASADLGIPVLYVVGTDHDLDRPPNQLMLSACGEAAHPDKERALLKALREFASSRSRKRFEHGTMREVASVAPDNYMQRIRKLDLFVQEPRAVHSMLEWIAMPRTIFYEMLRDRVLSVTSQVPFSGLPSIKEDGSQNPLNLLETIYRKISDAGFEIIYYPFATGSDGIHVIKAVVPGLEVETMSYGRVGLRNMRRLLQRNVDFVGLGSAPKGSVPVALRPEHRDALGGDAWLSPNALNRAVGKLYSLYREPYTHTLTQRLD